MLTFWKLYYAFMEVYKLKLDITSIIKNNGDTLIINMKEGLDELKTGIGTVSFIGPVGFSGHITNDNGMLILNGLAKTNYKATCDRCSKDLEREFFVDISENIVEQNEVHNEINENFLDDRYTFTGNSLDLDRIITDCILTNIPTSLICDDACRGLCNICGNEVSGNGCSCSDTDSTDSRFEILKDYFK